jgi:hypothetical protein
LCCPQSLVCPNGACKTTALSMAVGLLGTNDAWD